MSLELAEEYIDSSLGEAAPEREEEVRSEEIAKEVGRIVEKIERGESAEAEEEEITEYGVVIYRVEADLLSAMLYQATLYEKVLNGELSVTEARARIEKELAPIEQRLEQDLKKKEKKKTTRKRKKTTSKKSSKKKSKSG